MLLIRDEVYQLAEIFRALGDSTRLKIVKILASKMASDIQVTEIANRLGISQPAVSQHLKILKNVGILNAQRDGYRVFYNIDIETFIKHKQLIDTMFELVFERCGSECFCKEGN